MKKKGKMAARTKNQPGSRGMWALVILAGIVAIVLVWSVRDTLNEGRSSVTPSPSVRSDEASQDPVPPFYENPREAEPFPQTLSPLRFADPTVARVYQIAAEIPEVLAQQPCYCYCDGYGHRSLLHCYTDDHGAG